MNNSLKKIKNQLKKLSDNYWNGIWFCSGFIILLWGLLFWHYQPLVVIFCLVITIILSGIGISRYWRKEFKNETNEEVSNQNQSLKVQIPKLFNLVKKIREGSPLFLSISATLYAVIAGFAIIIMLRFAFEGIIDDLKVITNYNIVNATHSSISLAIERSWYEIIISGAFLATVIPFYHGAMLFLSDKSHILQEEESHKLARHFFALFIQSIIFLGVALSLGSFIFVIILFIALMFVDTVWVLITQTADKHPPVGWIFLNLGFTASLFLIIYPEEISAVTSTALLLITCVIRTTIDYVVFDQYFFEKTKN